MKLTKAEKQMYEVVSKAAEKYRVKWYILDSLAAAYFCFEDGDEAGMYFSLLDVHFYNDELMGLL